MENPMLKYLAFVKTVETGSFTRAARELDYAQSSVSKMVADLEREWHMPLLERSKHGVCLTSAGQQVMPFLRNLLNDYHALEGQISRMHGIETGIVRIGTFSSVSIHWLPNTKYCWAIMTRSSTGSRMGGWTAASCGFPPGRNLIRFC